MEPILSKGLFVILLHQGKGPDHFDLILEGNDHCPTFQFDSLPLKAGKRIKDHRKKYLHFEGKISPDKGTVIVSDKGTYEFDTLILKLMNRNKDIILKLQHNAILTSLEA